MDTALRPPQCSSHRTHSESLPSRAAKQVRWLSQAMHSANDKRSNPRFLRRHPKKAQHFLQIRDADRNTTASESVQRPPARHQIAWLANAANTPTPEPGRLWPAALPADAVVTFWGGTSQLACSLRRTPEPARSSTLPIAVRVTPVHSHSLHLIILASLH